jgi:hypothetical protein
MQAQSSSTPTRFSDRVFRFLERVEHRVAKSASEREAVFRLRYEAYVRNGLLEPRADRQLYDERYDDAPNSWITMTFVDGELAGTTRVNLGADENVILPCVSVYPEEITPQLHLKRVIVEFTRLAARLDLSGVYPELAYIIMRPGYLAAEHFSADFAVASPKAEHVAFYRRVFGGELLCEPRGYPGLTARFACMGADFRAMQHVIEARYPFFGSTAAEREALFGPAPNRTQARAGLLRQHDFEFRASA